MVDGISKFTNLKSLSLYDTEFTEKLDFGNFSNLKNLTSLEIHYTPSNPSNRFIQVDMLKSFKFLKSLIMAHAEYYEDTINAISDMTNLEELKLDGIIYKADLDLSSIKKLENLSSLLISCYSDHIISSDFLYLTKLKSLTLILYLFSIFE